MTPLAITVKNLLLAFKGDKTSHADYLARIFQTTPTIILKTAESAPELFEPMTNTRRIIELTEAGLTQSEAYTADRKNKMILALIDQLTRRMQDRNQIDILKAQHTQLIIEHGKQVYHLEDTVRVQKDYIRELEKDVDELRDGIRQEQLKDEYTAKLHGDVETLTKQLVLEVMHKEAIREQRIEDIDRLKAELNEAEETSNAELRDLETALNHIRTVCVHVNRITDVTEQTRLLFKVLWGIAQTATDNMRANRIPF